MPIQKFIHRLFVLETQFMSNSPAGFIGITEDKGMQLFVPYSAKAFHRRFSITFGKAGGEMATRITNKFRPSRYIRYILNIVFQQINSIF